MLWLGNEMGYFFLEPKGPRNLNPPMCLEEEQDRVWWTLDITITHLWLWAHCLTFLNFNFLFCEMGMTVAPTAYSHEKVNEINVCEALSTCNKQKMAVLWSLLSLSMRESAEPHNLVMHRFEFYCCHLPAMWTWGSILPSLTFSIKWSGIKHSP